MKSLIFSSGVRDRATSAGLLALRLGIGSFIALGHGWPKVKNWSAILENWKSPGFFPLSMMSSPVSLGAIVFAELVCGALLVLGLATRPAAAIIAFAMGVAAFYAHGADPFFMGQGAAKEPALLYLVPCVALLLTGAGGYSVDAALSKNKRRWGR